MTTPPTEQAKHTATPWRVVPAPADASFAIVADGRGTIAGLTCRTECEANAAFICTAVNAHQELVEALRATLRIVEDWETRMDTTFQAGTTARALLSKIGGAK